MLLTRVTCHVLVAMQHTKNLTQPYSRASYAGPFSVSDVGAAHHVTASGSDVNDVISIKSYPAAITPRRSPKTVDIEVCMCSLLNENVLGIRHLLSGLWSRSLRLGLETYQRLVSVSANYVSCPRPIFGQTVEATLIKRTQCDRALDVVSLCCSYYCSSY